MRGGKRKRRGARGVGLEVKAAVAVVAPVCLLLLQSGWVGWGELGREPGCGTAYKHMEKTQGPFV